MGEHLLARQQHTFYLFHRAWLHSCQADVRFARNLVTADRVARSLHCESAADC